MARARSAVLRHFCLTRFSVHRKSDFRTRSIRTELEGTRARMMARWVSPRPRHIHVDDVGSEGVRVSHGDAHGCRFPRAHVATKRRAGAASASVSLVLSGHGAHVGVRHGAFARHGCTRRARAWRTAAGEPFCPAAPLRTRASCLPRCSHAISVTRQNRCCLRARVCVCVLYL